MSSNKKLTLDEIKERMKILNSNIEILSKEHIDGILILQCRCLVDGHEWSANWSNLSKNKGCPKCAGKIFPTLEEIKVRINGINNKIEISEIYINKTKSGRNDLRCKCRCLIDGHEWDSSWNHLNRGTGCKKCRNLKIKLRNSKPNGNSIRDMHPEVIKYLANKNDADDYAHMGQRKIDVKCPQCGEIREMMVFDLCKRGFSCPVCSDGISIPEKFGISLCKQLGIEFEPQKSFCWSNKKRYDFYIPLLNTIIEVHGRQHYEDIFSYMSRAKNVIDEEANDKLKYNLAIENGIKPENYIVIDCRNSEFEWLKENYIKSLFKIFDLSNIDWDNIWLDCQKSVKKQVWDYWNNRDLINENVKTIAKKFKLSETTIRNYLKTGTSLGKCDYNSNKYRKEVV